MITAFGKFCRILRINNNEILKDMADKLNVTSSYLSAVENGKRNIPDEWFNKIISIYSLNKNEKETLKNAINESKKEITINLESLSSYDKNLALIFARKLESLNEESKKTIFDLCQYNKQ